MITNKFHRRGMLQSSVAAGVVTLGGLAPRFLHVAAQEANPKSSGDRILVVIELAGGNDGLNTIVPADHDAYRKARPKLAIPESSVLEIANGLGFHPALRGFADLLEAGQLAIVQGVGYDNPNRSHFESMDIWHTCQRKEDVRTEGWLGRFLNHSEPKKGSDPLAMHLGEDKQPFAVMSRTVRVPSIRSLEQFRLEGDGERFREVVRELTDVRREANDDLLNFVQSSTQAAIATSSRIEAANQSGSGGTTYPATQLGEKLRTVARLISSGLNTSIYYVQLDGFDTHAQQADAHAGLLRQLGDAMKAFFDDMAARKLSDRILAMSFSEFGRRVAENASEGSDHGTAGPMFLAGPSVKAGLIGSHPDLSQLQDGDLKHHTDFRQVYASVLQQWLGCRETRTILNGDFAPVEILDF